MFNTNANPSAAPFQVLKNLTLIDEIQNQKRHFGGLGYQLFLQVNHGLAHGLAHVHVGLGITAVVAA